MDYRREIDGLRAIAVLPVIFFHAGFGIFSGGYVGVDIFFVISGYLITSIILKDCELGTFTVKNFYERRARRILPALFFIIFACTPLAYYWMLPVDFRDFSQSLVSVILFSSNFLFWIESGYFAPDAELKPLLHTWSLAVEEQFYVIFPLFLIFFWKLGKRSLALIISISVVISFLLAEFSSRYYPDMSFYLTPMRAWELLIGSLVAFMSSKSTVRPSNLLSTIGLSSVVVSIFIFDHNTRWPSVFTLLPVIGTALIILYTSKNSWSYKILSSNILVGIGLISYSAYLWHQPLIAFTRIKSIYQPSEFTMGMLVILSLVLAWFTWKYVEKPFRKNSKGGIGLAKLLTILSTCTVVVLMVGVYGHVSNGMFEHWKHNNPEKAEVYSRLVEARTIAQEAEITETVIEKCIFRINEIDQKALSTLKECKATYGEGIAILGDSHAIDLFFAIVANNADKNFIVGVSQTGCRPHTTDQSCHYNDFLNSQTEHKFFETTIFNQAGFYLLQNPSKNISESRTIFEMEPPNSELSMIEVNLENINLVTEYLVELSNATNLVWLGPRIEHHTPEQLILDRGCDGLYDVRPGTHRVFKMLDQTIDESVDEYQLSSLSYISQSEFYIFDVRRDLISCDAFLWSDGDHWSSAGELHFGNFIYSGLIDLGVL